MSVKRRTVPQPLLSVLTVALCCTLCGGWGRTENRMGNVVPPPCPFACTCSLSSVPFFAKPLFSVQCRQTETVSWSVATCNATQALLLADSQLSALSSLPPFPHLRFLDLSFNRITCSHCRQFFQFMGILVHLNLSGNAIHTLQDNTFSGLSSLEVLDLSSNLLTVLEPHVFQGLGELSVLHLEDNQLYEVNRSWLRNLPLLQELYLQGNHIPQVEGYTFTHSTFLLQLDLSNNPLHAVADHGFMGLLHVKMLNLSNTELTSVPSAELQRLSSLLILLMDGIALTVVQPGDFSHLAVSSISLSFLPHLTLVSRGAFFNLTHLRTLQMHDNYQLVYIHPQAFHRVPLLHRLALHNNQLMTLSSDVRDSLPSLDELHVYHNPLHCDCNIRWLRRDLLAMEDSANGSVDASYLTHWDKLTCSTPEGPQGHPRHVALLPLLPASCTPTSLPFFPDTYHVTVGDEVSLLCEGMGVPQPALSWVLPDGQVINGSTTPHPHDHHHLTVSADSTALTVPGVQLQDQGTYSCRADNGLGFDISSTVVHVHNKDLTLSVTPSRDTPSLTVSWVGSVPLRQMGEYHLEYWQHGTSNVTVRVDLHSGMTNCTLTHFVPLTPYHLCLVFRDVFTVHCLNVTTGQRVLLATPPRTLSAVGSSVVSVCSVLGLLVLLVLLRRGVRRRRRWLRQKKKERSDSLTEDKDMEKILLDPIDQRVPDSPQCSARTSLLPRSYV